MVNLLGDLWAGGEPRLGRRCSPSPTRRLHLYGKASARPGRKMGHLTVLGDDAGRRRGAGRRAARPPSHADADGWPIR